MAYNLHGRHGNTHGETPRRNGRTTSPMTPQTSQTNSCKTPGAQPLPETGEMHFRATNDRISRGQRRSRDSTNGQHENSQGEELDHAAQHPGSLQIPRFHRVLPLLYPGLLEESPPTTLSNTQHNTLAMGTRPTDGI